MGDVVQLLKFPVPEDTVRTVRQLRSRKDLVGIAYVALYRGGRFEADVTDAALSSPLITRVLLLDLYHAMQRLSTLEY